MSTKNDEALLKFGAFAIIAGFALVRSGLKRVSQARKVQDTGSIPVASAPQGLVELQGFAWPMEPVPSPIDEKPCVYYSFSVEEKRRSGKSSKWVEIYSESSQTSFFLADDSGHAVVMPLNATLEVRSRTVPWSQLTPAVAARLSERYGRLDFKPPWQKSIPNILGFNDNRRVIEKVVLVGAPLYALGHFQTVALTRDGKARPANGLQLFMQKVAAFKRNPVSAAARLDANRDGRVSFEEWYAGYTKEALVAGSGFRNEPVVLPRGLQKQNECFGAIAVGGGHGLLLADCHQQELLERIGSWNSARIIGGALLIGVGAAMLYARLFLGMRL